MSDLRLAVTTASFLPWTALSGRAIQRVFDFATSNDFAGVEVLVTRAVCRAYQRGAFRDVAGLIVSSHEVWNPRETLASEIRCILRRIPQSRGMVPYPMDTLFFANSDISEKVAFALADLAEGTTVVSQLESPVTRRRYSNPRAAVQVHCDLGPDGSHLPLPEVKEIIVRQNYPVVLDTNHVRRRVRLYVNGQTEMAPPVAGPGDISFGGIASTWRAFGDRVALVHFQPNNGAELAELLRTRALPASLADFHAILPELASRNIPIVIEVSPPIAAAVSRFGSTLARKCAAFGVTDSAMKEVLPRVRDVLRGAAGGR